jgi:hypothetical protein
MKTSSCFWGLVLVSVLAACGGNGGQEASLPSGKPAQATADDLIAGQSSELASPNYGIPANGVDRAQMLRKLSAHFDGRFADQPEALMGAGKSVADSMIVGEPTKSAAESSVAAVYRFLNTKTGVHFYTMSESEKARVMQSLPHFNYEGEAFFALTGDDVPLKPVFRFYSIYTGTHFYTIDPEERDYVIANYWQYFSYEGVAWYATTYAGPGWLPMHRFYNTETGTHFYTTSKQEVERVKATLPGMEYEGIGYFVRSNGVARPVSPISHSGAGGCISSDLSANSFVCNGVDTLPLKSQVEGNREVGMNLGRFVEVPGQTAADCTVDKVTGLVWETKSSDPGPRWSGRRFTHLDRTDRMQVVDTSYVWIASASKFEELSISRTPTQAEIDSIDNSKAYVDYVNGIALCGYTDWRIPSASELVNVLDFGFGSFTVPQSSIGPYISSDPVTFQYDGQDTEGQAMRYTVDGVAVVSSRAQQPNRPNSNGDFVTFAPRSGSFTLGYVNGRSLMLVRGAVVPIQSRYSLVSIPYGRDAANNVVLDNWSKLQWRRCLEGETWDGSTCSGQPLALNLYDALARASAHPGWRLPGIKELDSIHSRPDDLSAVQWDAEVFPSSLGYDSPGLWSMSIQWGFLSESENPEDFGKPGYQVFFGRSSPTVPTASLSLMSRNKMGYSRLLRVHP